MSYIVRIPEPCHEDWNKMTPEPTGRHCQSCNKTVIDFSNKTDNEIHSIIISSKEQNICGHFKKSQVNRPMKLTIPLHLIPQNISSTKVFALALFFAFGTLLFSCTADNGTKVGEIEIENREMLMGAVPLPNEDTAKVDSVRIDTIEEPMLDGEMKIERIEPMVNGGLGYYKEPVIETEPVVPVEPTVAPEPEIMMLGGAIAYTEFTPVVIEPDNTTITGEQADEKRIDVADIKETTGTVYPNPSSGEFNIKYDVTQKGLVQVDLYDINGKLVKNIVNNQMQHTGKYVIPVDLKGVANGIYICTIIVNGKKITERVVIDK
ncbi:MAG TPA: T9SS type A sorting domain-containing protein [Bacteroidia bacterium]